MNIGNPTAISIMQLAETIRDAAGSSSLIVKVERPVDDPELRCPDFSMARRLLGWEPTVHLRDGLARTIEWARVSWTS